MFGDAPELFDRNCSKLSKPLSPGAVDQAPPGYVEWLTRLKADIRRSQTRALVRVNAEMIHLYWCIGRDILERQGHEGWGAKIVDRIAVDLRNEFPGVDGFSRTNLLYMRAFAEAWADEEFVQRVVGQIPWGLNIELLTKLKDAVTRRWYAQAALQYGWSRPALAHQIETRLYERDGKSLNNFTATLPPPESDMVAAAFKDPYTLDFVTLAPDAHERHLEAKLIERIRDFLLEMGKGFAFVGSQYHLAVGDQDFYIDLLLYHIPLHRYVVVDLKMGRFTAEFAGKMNFYINAVNRQLRTQGDNEAVGLVLCRERDRLIVDYSLGGITAPIAVAKYEHTVLPATIAAALPAPEVVEAGVVAIFADETSDSDQSNEES